MLVPCAKTSLSPPEYTTKEVRLAKNLKCTKQKDGWWETPNAQILITKVMNKQLMKNLYEGTDFATDAVVNLKSFAVGPTVQAITNQAA